jgi:hypothetical protein
MHRAHTGFLLVLGLLFSSCVEGPAARPAAAERAGAVAAGVDNVILVTLDGVRWQEIFTGADPELADGAGLPVGERRGARGLTPNLHRLFFDQGVVLGDPRAGEPFVASGPNFVSLPGYVEIMTGAASGCAGNECEPHVSWAIAGEAAGAPGDGAAVFSSWERIARAVPVDTSGLLLRAGREPGEQAPPYPGNGEYRPDLRTAAMAVDHLVHRRPRFLWVALGDTDEWAHRHDYRGYLDALRFADDFVGELSAHLAAMGDYGARTAILVTTDHGRDADFADHGGPASAAVWLMAGGGPIARRGSTPLPRTRGLRDIAPTIAAILHEPGPRGAACGEVLGELL